MRQEDMVQREAMDVQAIRDKNVLLSRSQAGTVMTNTPRVGESAEQTAMRSAPRDIVSEITKARGSVYGPFLHNAIVAQALKRAMRGIPDPDNEGVHWENLPLDVREALDLIALKISRIVTGTGEHLDNWDDIGGYSKLVADRIRADRAA